jgi:geranylgeranyl pyrophosphate synthase
MTGTDWLQRASEQVDPALDRSLPPDDTAPEPLYRAMRYALMAPGKRFRPALVYAAGQWLGVSLETLTPVAVAVEMVHTYSLVHDDLPAMDNDDWRRGRPTVHRAFSEDIAILVGDALLTEAFAALARAPFAPPCLVAGIARLAGAAGHVGLVGGQVRDLYPGPEPGPEALEALHRAKTGALISASVTLPAILAGREGEVAVLEEYGSAVGLAFQITDDILDVVGDQAVMGKAQGRDARQGKTTYLSLYGIECARHMADEQLRRAEALVPGRDGEALRALARFVVERDR